MSGHRQYKNHDFRFGLMTVGFRERVGLTQQDVADAVHVSRRTIQYWESGTTFPDTSHLKDLIAYLVSCGAFAHGHEKDEIKSLWVQADESADRRKTLFDEIWVDQILAAQTRVDAEKAAFTEKKNAAASVDDTRSAISNIDWGDAPDVRKIFGREDELALLADWTLHQNARMVVVLGIGGIGKTTLATKFAQNASSQFEYVIWSSVQNAPPLEELLLEIFQVLSPVTRSKPTISNLLELLQKHRCLLILDNVDSLHKAGSLLGEYRDGYEDYQALFQRLAQSRHKGCVILTSRALPIELEPFEGEQSSVRVMRVSGITWEASQGMLKDKSLFGSDDSWKVFVHYYGGNPLALKIAANTVRDLFGGDLSAFFKEAPVTLHTLQHLLDNQFEHLSALEQEILYWLAIERDAVSLEELRKDISGKATQNAILTALLSLRQRSLIERGETGAIFTLLPVVLEYLTNRIVSQASEEIANKNFRTITKYSLLKSNSRVYVRESQARMILMPILAILLGILGDSENLSLHFRSMVEILRRKSADNQGYSGGNLVNFLASLNGHIRREDFSNLILRQVYLQGIEAQDANFSGSEFINPLFTEPIETTGAMTLSPKGQFLTASTYSGEIHVWRAEDSKPLWTVTGLQRIWTLAFSPDESVLASGGFNGEICLWETSTGKLLNKVAGHRVWAFSLGFQPDGRRIASGGFYGSVRVWNTQDLSLQYELEGHTNSVISVSFTPDGSFLVTGSKDGSIRVWDLSDGHCLHALQHGDSDTIVRACIHPAGNLIASCCEDDSFIKIWDLKTGACLVTLKTHSHGTASIAFDPEGEILAYGNSDGGVELWKIEPGVSPQYLKMLIGHQYYVEVLSFAENGLLASLAYGEDIKLWDTRSGKLLKSIKGYSRLIGATTFSMDGKWLVQGDANGMIRILDLANKRYRSTFQAHAGPIWKIVISPDNKTFASCGDDRLVKIWDFYDLKCLNTFSGHTGNLWELAFSPDGRLLASGGKDRWIKIWNAAGGGNGIPIQSIQQLFDQVWSLAFDPGGNVLASGHTNGEINLWDTATGNHLKVISRATNKWGDLVGTLRFSSDGKHLYSSSANEILGCWDIATGERTGAGGTVIGNRNKAIEIGPNGRFVVTGSAEPVVYFWPTGEERESIEPVKLIGHTSRVWAVAVSPDECLLASSDEEGTTILHDFQDKKVLERISLDRPYERMNIKAARGLNLAERAALYALGASDTEL